MSQVHYSNQFTGTAAALGTIECKLGDSAVFKVVTSGSETVSVTGLVGYTSAGAEVVSAQIMCYSLATGALHSSVNMDDGTYYIPQLFTQNLIFLGSGASDTKTVTVNIKQG